MRPLKINRKWTYRHFSNPSRMNTYMTTPNFDMRLTDLHSIVYGINCVNRARWGGRGGVPLQRAYHYHSTALI